MNILKDWLKETRHPGRYAALTVDTTGFHNKDRLLAITAFVPDSQNVEYWYLDMPDPTQIQAMAEWINPLDYLTRKESPDAVKAGLEQWIQKHVHDEERFLVVFNRRFQRRFLSSLVKTEELPMLDMCLLAVTDDTNFLINGTDIESVQNEIEAQLTGHEPVSFKELCVRFSSNPYPTLPNVNKVLKLDYVYRSLMEVKGTW
jgi:hypothetical protein